MIARLAAAVAAVLTIASGAEAAIVRSGEHDAFSRLVFADRPGRSWSVERDGRRSSIAFAGAALDLDLSEVFDRIPRRRISSATFADGRLDLVLSCDCAVEVTQIPTGHVVIDVRDPAAGAGDGRAPTSGSVLPLLLPLAEIRLTPSLRAIWPSSSDANPDAEGPRQVRIHPAGAVTARGPLPAPPHPSPAACPFEDQGRSTFVADPEAAYAALPDGVAAVLDGRDEVDGDGLQRLATLYLAAGFGAEALQAAGPAGAPGSAIAVVAAALDGLPYPPATAIDPACGAASAILALLDPSRPDGMDRADQDAIAPFLDAMHPAMAANLVPRLERRLGEIGLDHLLAPLLPQGGDPVGADPDPADAAGTDEAAIAAAIALLDRAGGPDESADETHLVNAMALVQSVPAGDLRRELDRAIASALVHARRPVEAAVLAAEGRADADALLVLAIDAHPPEAAAEFAVRLGPYLAPDGEAARSAGTLMRSFGLEVAAGRFATSRAEGPVAVTDPVLPPEPWLVRDLPEMVRTEREAWTVRNRLAESILERRDADMPDTDLAAAAATLEESRALSALVAELVGVEGGGVTGR